MMTLDEAIRRERHAMRQTAGERSEEHRQMAEWLKELKQWKELVEGIDLRPASLMKPFQPNVNDLERENDRLKAENDSMHEVIVRMHGLLLEKCESPHERYHGKPCESCAEAGTDDCPKVIARQLRKLGIEVEE